MTQKEVKDELLSEIQSLDDDDMVGSEFHVGELYIHENDLPEYIGKMHI